MSKQSTSSSKIAKNTALLYVRMLLLLGVSLYTSRVVLATLGVVDYGIYNVVGGVVSMFTFINMAMGNASSRYITYALGKGDISRLQIVFNTSLLVHFVIALFIVLIAETVGLWLLNCKMVIPSDRIVAAHWVYQFSIISCVASMMCVPFNATIIAHEKMGAFAYISIMDASLKLLVVFLLQCLPFDNLILYGLLYMFVNLLDVTIYELYCVKNFKEIKFSFPNDRLLIKEMTTFAGWSMIGNLACVGYNQGLNILINIFFGPAVNAARGVAYQVQGAVKSFITNFQTAANPQITKSYAIGDYGRLHSLLFSVSKLSYFLLLCLALPISICSDTILSIWLVEVPEHCKNFLILILLVSLIDTLERPVNTSMNATGEIKKYQLVSCSIQVLVVPFAYLVLKFGSKPEMIFIVYLFIMGLAYLSELLILYKKIDLDLRLYFKKVIFRIVIVTVVSILISILISYVLNDGSISHSLIVGVFVFLSVLMTIWHLGLENKERQMILNKVLNKISKIQ